MLITLDLAQNPQNRTKKNGILPLAKHRHHAIDARQRCRKNVGVTFGNSVPHAGKRKVLLFVTLSQHRITRKTARARSRSIAPGVPVRLTAHTPTHALLSVWQRVRQSRLSRARPTQTSFFFFCVRLAVRRTQKRYTSVCWRSACMRVCMRMCMRMRACAGVARVLTMALLAYRDAWTHRDAICLCYYTFARVCLYSRRTAYLTVITFSAR